MALRGLPTAAALVALLAATAGCGQASSEGAGAPGGGAGGGSAAPTAASSSPATAGTPGTPGTPGSSASASKPCRTPTPTPSGSAQVVHLTAADGGATVCVSQGELVEVDLTASSGRPWVITAVGAALKASSGSRTPGAGRSPVFEAVAPGTAAIRGTRRACGAPGHGGVACGAIQAYSVSVVVR